MVDQLAEAAALDLRAAFAAALLGPVAMTACPPAGTLWDAARGDLPIGRREEVVDHLASCPMCAESWRLALRGGARSRPA